MITPSAPPRRLLDHIIRCNARDEAHFRAFTIGGKPVGSVREDFAVLLAQFTEIFEIDAHEVRLAPHLATPEQRTEALQAVVKGLIERGALAKFRAEMFPVVCEWGQEPLCVIDRSAVTVFGIQAFGVHVNGFTKRGGKTVLWIGRRAVDKAVEPGKLDNMVAGGQPAGLSLVENMIKEAHEEADVPRALAQQARSTTALRYCMDSERGRKPDTLFVYDLEVPPDFTPRNTDGEIMDFMPMMPEAIIERLRTTWDFKFNVALVLIDFLIRTGHITPENEPDYLKLVTELHHPL